MPSSDLLIDCIFNHRVSGLAIKINAINKILVNIIKPNNRRLAGLNYGECRAKVNGRR